LNCRQAGSPRAPTPSRRPTAALPYQYRALQEIKDFDRCPHLRHLVYLLRRRSLRGDKLVYQTREHG